MFPEREWVRAARLHTGPDTMRKLFVFFCIALIAACGEPPPGPEEALRAWVARGEAAAEDKDRGELLDMISASYADSRGNDRERIGDLLRLYFLRQQSIALLTSIDDIRVVGESAATIDLTVGMAGTRGGAIGLDADAYRFEFELEKPGDEWLLIGARWGELGGELR